MKRLYVEINISVDDKYLKKVGDEEILDEVLVHLSDRLTCHLMGMGKIKRLRIDNLKVTEQMENEGTKMPDSRSISNL